MATTHPTSHHQPHPDKKHHLTRMGASQPGLASRAVALLVEAMTHMHDLECVTMVLLDPQYKGVSSHA